MIILYREKLYVVLVRGWVFIWPDVFTDFKGELNDMNRLGVQGKNKYLSKHLEIPRRVY